MEDHGSNLKTSDAAGKEALGRPGVLLCLLHVEDKPWLRVP